MKLPKEFDFICIAEWDDELYQEALLWVDDSKSVAILSREKRESADPRVQIYYVESLFQKRILAKKIAWSAVMKKMHVIGEGPFKEELEMQHLLAFTTLSEAADYWTLPMKNAKMNDAPHKRGIELKGAFQNIPALIVGAGPSLERNGHLIRQFEDKALIFAGGTALNLIDTEPHFAASIDAIAPHEQFKMHPFSKTPFCYQSRLNPDNFSTMCGEKLLFPDSSCAAINWIQGEEGFDAGFSAGWTVGNFLTEIAILMGCSPIFLIGMDLCYENGRKYAKIESDLPSGLIQVEDVLTQKDWLMAARWTEEKGGEMFDLSQGMLKLPKMKPEEALKMCKLQKDLRSLVQDQIQKLPAQNKSRWNEWEASFQRCKENENIEEEIVYQKLLAPLWQIWMPIFDNEGQDLLLHQKLFFQRVLEEHEAVVLQTF